MMTERLKAAVEQAAQLPQEMQDTFAQHIEDAYWEADNALWDAELRDPKNIEALAKYAEHVWDEPGLPFPQPRDFGPHDDYDKIISGR